jgi:hypothetical protein
MAAMLCSCWLLVAISRSKKPFLPHRHQVLAVQRRSSAHEFIRHTQQYSRTVTSVFLCADSTSMIEIHQHLNGVLNNLTLRYFIERSDHTHTAGVMLRIRVVHPVWSVDREI